jgi:hypothetical protein
MKVSELQGVPLDWAVAKCEKLVNEDGLDVGFIRDGVFTPSTDWAQGGPIIEREKIGLHCGDGTWGVDVGIWEASHSRCLYIKRGPTPLIAAMRCYVASKLGAEIELPEEVK